jgi:ADP-heptose:LPS heptosyltransferase
VIEAVFPRKLLGGRGVIGQADAARDAAQYQKAALLYEKHLRRAPDDAAIHVQCGHMFKEARDFVRAEQHYECARKLTPDDADLALQFGHLYKVTGRLDKAELAFRRAIDLAPDWPEPAVQLTQLYRGGWRDHTGHNGAEHPIAQSLGAPDLLKGDAGQSWFDVNQALVPELAPRGPDSMLHGHKEEIAIRWFGHWGRSAWGMFDILRGVEAIRGFCISAVPIVEVRASLGGLHYYSGTLQSFPLKYEKFNRSLKKYVFNIWYDFSHFHEGMYEGRLDFVDADGGVRTYTRQLVVAEPLREEDYPDSDRLVSLRPDDNRPIEEQVNSRPSMIRTAQRARFPTPPKSVLVIRVDQLGDLVVSVPGLRRLRQLLPQARIVGLLSRANAELGKTLELFDEIVAVDFPDDDWERRRVMPLQQQHELRRRLASYKFDVAIDLIESTVSRPLLVLSGAPYQFGFRDDWAPWMSGSFAGITRDPRNGHEAVPHSVRLLGMIEWLGAILGHHAEIVRRADLCRERLAPYGLAAADRYAVLHTGARLKFSQWPHYDKLAAMILDQTDLKVVMMSDDPALGAQLPRALLRSPHFRLLDRQLPFDDFDALLSFCTVFVGNDSGPAHVASLRGAPVVNLYMARHNWGEWGHENRGYVISRRVPCAGCNIHHDPEECGKGYACIVNIAPDEVFRTVMEFV